MIVKQVETWKAIVLLVQFFCLGGSSFCENETAKAIMQGIIALCFIVGLIGF